ncbi:MAG: hypothetical protein LBB59_03435 [Campylobacteraceae bacterium]|jgi:hypothetical protein|nr:hypothetical protein [Campylobacteraceae bacterium]
MRIGYKLAASSAILAVSTLLFGICLFATNPLNTSSLMDTLLLDACARLCNNISITFAWLVIIAFIVALPLTILYLIDLGRELRDSNSTTPFRRAAGLFLGLPQAIFGLLSIIIGAAIIIWVVYNSLWQRSPNYTGGFLRFGLGPGLVLFGLGLFINAFKRDLQDKE